MKIIKNILLKIGIISLAVFIYLTIITILSNLNIINYKMTSILNYIFISLLTFTLGIKYSKKGSKKGFISGIIIGLISVFILILLSLIITKTISLKSLIYYTTLILSSMFGGILGINLKQKNIR